MAALDKRLMELHETKAGLWKIKEELFTLLLVDLDPHLSSLPDAARQMQIRAEIRDTLGAGGDIVGVFPVGGTWGHHTALDIHQLVKRDLRALLLPVTGKACWVPLSQAEMTKKRKRQQDAGLTTAKGRGRGDRSGPGEPSRGCHSPRRDSRR
ncbi:unnamed protein product [Symbiodinium natans]|uniref:Uncharacterized protein n=1 Tax=Symbiodinium natans TaxID=878477 RepID=A0A812UU43_9DINO|nr:unnamed protein product [Symbiodinium natans]